MEILLPVISRWAHVGTAILLVGGTAFFRLAVIPALGENSQELVGRIRDNWRKFVHIGVLVFLVSGFYNYIQAAKGPHKGDSLYHMLVGTKMLLALFVFFLASALVGKKPGTQKFRDNAEKWTGIMLLVATIIIGISGFVKVRPVPSQAGSSADTTVAD